MRTERELLELLKSECELRLMKDSEERGVISTHFGICAAVFRLNCYNEITSDEHDLLEETLKNNWGLSKYPERNFKFDTKTERIEFLDKLIERYK